MVQCSGRATTTPEVGRQQPIPELKPDPPQADMQRMTSAWPSQETYAPEGRPAQEKARPASTALAQRLLKLSKQARRIPHEDWRLDRAATDLAAVLPLTGRLPPSLVTFAIHHHGIVEPSPNVFTVQGIAADAVPTYFAQKVSPWLQRRNFAAFGLGRAHREGGAVWVLLLMRSRLQLKPVPRRQPLNGEFLLRGRLLGRASSAQLLVSRPSGVVTEQKFGGKRPRLRAQVECKAERGQHRIEIVADLGRGVEMLANFPVYCGVQPPEELAWQAAPLADLSAEGSETALLALINRDRKRAGLKMLKLDPQLQRVARKYSEEMVRTGMVAHVSAETGSVTDRLRAAGIRSPIVAENLARSLNARSAHRGLMNSPGHRANILFKAVTHVGVGVSMDGPINEPSSRSVVVTEIFTGPAPTVNPEQARERMARRMPKRMRRDPVLEEIASWQLQAMKIPAGSTEAILDNAVRALKERNYNVKRIVTRLLVLSNVEAFQLGHIGDRSLLHYGMAVRQAPFPDLGERALYVLLFLAER